MSERVRERERESNCTIYLDRKLRKMSNILARITREEIKKL